MYVYILECSDGTYYTGVTNNIDRRMQQHQIGTSRESYTFSRRPVELVFCEKIEDPQTAIDFEKKIKRWSGKKKKALIEEKWEVLQLLAECKNESNYLVRTLDIASSLDFARDDAPFSRARHQAILVFGYCRLPECCKKI